MLPFARKLGYVAKCSEMICCVVNLMTLIWNCFKFFPAFVMHAFYLVFFGDWFSTPEYDHDIVAVLNNSLSYLVWNMLLFIVRNNQIITSDFVS